MIGSAGGSPAEPIGVPMSRRFDLAVIAAIILALAVSGIGPYDRLTWWLEVAPVLIVLPIMLATRRAFPLTDMLLLLIAAHCVVLMVGGHWTYARVPAGDWVRDAFGLSRNPYDRLGHFMQGFVPALAAREILLRLRVLNRRGFLPFLVLCICLAVSAAYELVEWSSALILGQGADEFLGTQGDPWDTQWDMFSALVGASCALAFASGAHDRSMAKLEASAPDSLPG
jgi:putative membrane protein